MAFEKKPNTGALFINDKRETDKHPNAKGDAVIDGVEYWVSAWTNTAKSGSKYQSLKFERKEQQGQSKPSQQAPADDDLADDIPF